MSSRGSARLPVWHRRLAFRVGLWIAASILIVDIALIPFLPEIYKFFHPEWWDPDHLRAVADRLEIEAAPQPPEQSETVRAVASTLLAVAYALTFALVAAFFIARVPMRRLTRLTLQVSEDGPSPTALPGPFEEHGRDEISILAAALNQMRSRVDGLLETLEARDRERREWIARVSHDIRTPLTSLVVRLDRMEKELGDHSTLSDIRADADRVTALTDDLLEIARLDAVDALHFEPVPPRELAERTVRSLCVLGEQRGIQVNLEAKGELPILEADGYRLARALENIILNSIQHAKSTVDVSVQQNNGAVEITVEDDGPGLDGSEEREPRPDSSGLGLVVATRVVEAHGGSLRVGNRSTGGARLVLSIPTERSS